MELKNQNILVKEVVLKSYQNNKRQFYQDVGGKCPRTYQQTDAKEAKQLWFKIWKKKEQKVD